MSTSNLKLANGTSSNIDTHIPFRATGGEPPNTKPIPLCNKFPSEGNIILKYSSDYSAHTGIFSFTIYSRNGSEQFRKSPYFIGLLLYAEIIHSPLFPFFSNTGLILYTDKNTYSILYPFFAPYEKVIFGITEWPAFAIEDTIEDSILRCLRFHAVEAFPMAWICCRDADTIFPNEIFLCDEAYSKGYKGIDSDGRVVEDYRVFLVEQIGKWEQLFILTWLDDEKNPIYLGTSPTYRAGWHTNMGVQWPIKTLWKNDTYKKKRGPNGSSVNIGYERLGRFSNYEEETGTSFIMRAPFGIWAGFCNFSNERPHDIWELCYDYITQRYTLVNDTKYGLQISNSYIKLDYAPMDVGKDERIILFAIIPKYVKLCYFYWINYTENLKSFLLDLERSPEYTSFETIGIVAVTLLTFNNIKIKSNNNLTTRTIQSKMLQPAYVSYQHSSLKLTPKYINKIISFRNDLSSYLPENLTTFDLVPGKIKNRQNETFNKQLLTYTVNDLFKIIFTKFANAYNRWMFTLMKNANIQSKINTVKTKERITGYVNDYVGLVNPTNFYVPPSLIRPSRLSGGRTQTQKIKNKKRRFTVKNIIYISR